MSKQQEEDKSVQGGSAEFSALASGLAEVGQGFYRRGWVLGTSGNFSAVVSREPYHEARIEPAAELVAAL